MEVEYITMDDKTNLCFYVFSDISVKPYYSRKLHVSHTALKQIKQNNCFQSDDGINA